MHELDSRVPVRAGSPGSGLCTGDLSTAQKVQRRVQLGPSRRNVAVPVPKHSNWLGH